MRRAVVLALLTACGTNPVVVENQNPERQVSRVTLEQAARYSVEVRSERKFDISNYPLAFQESAVDIGGGYLVASAIPGDVMQAIHYFVNPDALAESQQVSCLGEANNYLNLLVGCEGRTAIEALCTDDGLNLSIFRTSAGSLSLAGRDANVGDEIIMIGHSVSKQFFSAGRVVNRRFYPGLREENFLVELYPGSNFSRGAPIFLERERNFYLAGIGIQEVMVQGHDYYIAVRHDAIISSSCYPE